ncbi:MAG: YbjN domain-containing protein [Acidimicrobiales bacterium]
MDDCAPPTAEERESALASLTSWLVAIAENPVVAAVVADDESELDRWFVRVNGDSKDVYSVWFTMGQRTLAYETYVMPAPDENHAQFYEQLLRRNDKLHQLAFTVGDEHAVFLKGRIDIRHVTQDALDQVLGSVYAAIELAFLPAIRVGFASKFGT